MRGFGLQLIGALVLCFFLSGCSIFSNWFSEPKIAVVPEHHNDKLPDDIPSLSALAKDKIFAQRSAEELIIAVAALEKIQRLLGEQLSDVEPFDVFIQIAHACHLINEIEKDSSQALSWVVKGEDAARNAKYARPDRVEGHYYLAMLLGRRAERGGLGGIGMVKEVEELGLKCIEIDPSFADGGPYRLLAMLYAKAPPWPTSVGDIDLAVEYAQKALELSDMPVNHMIYAEVLIEDDELELAREQLKIVLAAPKVGTWAIEGELWRPYARQLLKRLEQGE